MCHFLSIFNLLVSAPVGTTITFFFILFHSYFLNENVFQLFSPFKKARIAVVSFGLMLQAIIWSSNIYLSLLSPICLQYHTRQTHKRFVVAPIDEGLGTKKNYSLNFHCLSFLKVLNTVGKP